MQSSNRQVIGGLMTYADVAEFLGVKIETL